MTSTTEETNGKYRVDNISNLFNALAEDEVIQEMRNPHASSVGALPLTQQQVETRLGDSILKRIAWSLPASALQKSWLLSLGGESSSDKTAKVIGSYYQYHRQLKTREKIRKAMQYARSHGGAVVVMVVDDGKHYSEPVNERSIKNIKGLIVRHRWQIAPYLRMNHQVFDLDDIEHYEILTLDKDIQVKLLFEGKVTKQNDRLIHKSRTLRFDGSLMPDDWMLSRNNGWGLSVFDEIWKYYKYYQNGLNGVGELIKTHSVLQHSIQGLRDLMKTQSEESANKIKQTMKMIRLTYDIYGMILHDSSEEFSWSARPVTGMDALVNIQRDAFIGASGMPHTKLFGESPGGLGRDGKETQINWANTVAEYQAENLEPPLDQLDRLIFLSKNGPTKGKVPENYQRQYPSVLRLTIEDIRQGRSSDVQALASGIQAGFITVDEARTVPSNPDWWSELTLDQQKWEEEKKKAEEQANALGGFDMNSVGGEEESPAEEPTEEPAPTEQMDSMGFVREPIKRIFNWQGLNIGITHNRGDIRFKKTMMADYGHIRGSYGKAEDSKAIDVYVNNPESSAMWKVRQLNPYSGELDETKYFIGFNNAKEVKDCYEYHAGSDRFGGVEKCAPTELNQYRQDADLEEEDWLAQELQQQLGYEVSIWASEIRKIMGDVRKNYNDDKARQDALEERINELELPSESITEKIYQNRVLADLAGRLNTEVSDTNQPK